MSVKRKMMTAVMILAAMGGSTCTAHAATVIYANFGNDTSYDTIPGFGTTQTFDLNTDIGAGDEEPSMVTNALLVDSTNATTGITLTTTMNTLSDNRISGGPSTTHAGAPDTGRFDWFAPATVTPDDALAPSFNRPSGGYIDFTLDGFNTTDVVSLDLALIRTGSGDRSATVSVNGTQIGSGLTSDADGLFLTSIGWTGQTSYTIHSQTTGSGWAALMNAMKVTVSGELIYREDFEDVTGTTNDQPLSAYGWQGVNRYGTTLTDLTVNPSRVVAEGDMEGQWRTYQGNGSWGDQWLTTDEVNFDQADYLDDLALSFMHRESNMESSDGYRIAFEIGGAWYLQDTLISSSVSLKTENLDISSLGFFEWTGAPADDSSAWSVPGMGGGSALPPGTITGLGLMLVKSDDSNETWRFDDVRITATPAAAPIPEPMTMLAVGMGIAGVGGYVHKRRRA